MMKGVRVLLLEHHDIFSSLYPTHYDSASRVRLVTAYSKAPIMAMHHLGMKNPMVVTNDWTGGFLAGLCKNNDMHKLIPGAHFFHIFHNLDKDYEGRIYLNWNESYYPEIHHLPYWYVINEYWSDKIINPSRAALFGSDQWGTVSKSYRQEIISTSPIRDMLHRF